MSQKPRKYKGHVKQKEQMVLVCGQKIRFKNDREFFEIFETLKKKYS